MILAAAIAETFVDDVLVVFFTPPDLTVRDAVFGAELATAVVCRTVVVFLATPPPPPPPPPSSPLVAAEDLPVEAVARAEEEETGTG